MNALLNNKETEVFQVRSHMSVEDEDCILPQFLNCEAPARVCWVMLYSGCKGINCGE